MINFDFPSDGDAYVQRVGRTARGNNKGTALSLISAKELDQLNSVEERLKTQFGLSEEENVFRPYRFRMSELDGFRYRARDAWRSVTKIAVRESRLKELRHEMLNSTKLRSHFNANPRDLQLLRHDKALHTVKHQSHLANVPDYIVPKVLKKMSTKRGGKKQGHLRKSQAKQKFKQKKADPLRNLAK